MMYFSCVVGCINLQASEWLNVSFHHNFNFYYKKTSTQNLKVLDSLLRLEFQKIEQKINYNSNQSIDIFIQENRRPNSILVNTQINPGEINVLKPKINLQLYTSPIEVLSDFRLQVSKILIESG